MHPSPPVSDQQAEIHTVQLGEENRPSRPSLPSMEQSQGQSGLVPLGASELPEDPKK